MKPVGNTERKRVVWQDIRPVKAIEKNVIKQKPKRKFIISFSKLSKFHTPKVITKIRQHVEKSKRKRFFFVIPLLIAIAVIAVYFIQQNNHQNTPSVTKSSGSNTPVNTVGKLVPGTPTYTAILPTGKNLKDLGGSWVRSDKQPSFIYVDKIGTAQINVSEQPLPDSFKDDSAHEVQALATSFNATEKISLGTNTIYIGSYGQDIQRVIFTKNDLLVLITSNGTVSASQWATYVSSLN